MAVDKRTIVRYRFLLVTRWLDSVGWIQPAGIAGGAFRNPLQVEFAVEHRASSMCLLAFTCICARKTIQVQHYLGRRLSLSHNLRPDGISRNACPCNRTVGTGGSVRNGAVEIGRGGGYAGTRREARDTVMPSCAGTCSFMRVAGDAIGGFKRRLRVEGKRAGYGCKRDTRVEGERGRRWEARGWHSAVSPVCAYMPSCVIDSPRSPAALRAYVLHATRYSYLYSELCEINPSLRTSPLLSSLLPRTSSLLPPPLPSPLYFALFFCSLLPLTPSHPQLLCSASLDST